MLALTQSSGRIPASRDLLNIFTIERVIIAQHLLSINEDIFDQAHMPYEHLSWIIH